LKWKSIFFVLLVRIDIASSLLYDILVLMMNHYDSVIL